jgi:phosphatidylserine/phosphatidylglycerophosphate/cardiolipin synthase-like enzyme
MWKSKCVWAPAPAIVCHVLRFRWAFWVARPCSATIGPHIRAARCLWLARGIHSSRNAGDGRKTVLKLIKRLLGAVLLLIVLAAIGVGYHLYRGGSTDGLGKGFSDAVEAAGKWLAKAPSALEELKDKAADSIPREITLGGGDGPEETPETGEEAHEAPASDAEEGGPIRVYFAPCSPANAMGIDDRLAELIQSAKETVLCAFFDLELEPVADALVAQHEEGVRVSIVTDTDYSKREALKKCRLAGIPIVYDNRSAFMHNKFCVVDGTFVWTGSMNVTSNGAYRNNNNALLFESSTLADNFSNEFDEMFVDRKFGPRSPRNTRYPNVVVHGTVVECFFAPEDNVAEELVKEILDAKKAIEFMAFSFTSRPIADAMIKRRQKGVTVRGVFEARNMESRYCQDDYLDRHGVDVYADTNEYTMHHKVIIIDRAVVVTGSYNFSKSADASNDENLLIVRSPGLAAKYVRELESLIAN